jgi:nitrate/nitrite transporter NarK
MERRFTALRVMATVFKILAWIAFILGLIAAIGAIAGGFVVQDQQGLLGLDVGGPLAGIALFLVLLIVAIVNFLLYYAIGESIVVFLSIEENTRQMAHALQQQAAREQTAYAPTVSVPEYSD